MKLKKYVSTIYRIILSFNSKKAKKHFSQTFNSTFNIFEAAGQKNSKLWRNIVFYVTNDTRRNKREREIIPLRLYAILLAATEGKIKK